jgi:hypothetical protein
MTYLELSVSDALIWSITLELSIMILEASFDDCNVLTTQATSWSVVRVRLEWSTLSLGWLLPCSKTIDQLERETNDVTFRSSFSDEENKVF